MPKTPAYRTRPGYPNALVTLTDSITGKHERASRLRLEVGGPGLEPGTLRM